MQIAIDGPVAAGKGTVGKLVAKQLGYFFVDTGALFRACSVFCDEQGVAKDQETTVCDLFKKNLPKLEMRDPTPQEMDGRLCTILLDREDISWKIRTDESSRGSSLVARYLCIRDFLLQFQRDIATKQSVVMEGRDICSFVLPNAEVKIFLTASVEIRAKRRRLEMLSQGVDTPLSEVIGSLQARDRQDMERPLRPLKKTENAIEIDTSEMTIEEVVDHIVSLAKQHVQS